MIDLDSLSAPDHASAGAVRDRAAQVLRPTGAFARLDELAAWLAAWQRTPRPAVDRPACIVFVADHGVAARTVSAYPASVTGEMLRALRSGAATASVLAVEVGARLGVVDVGVGRPTADLVEEAALDEGRFAEAWAAGVAAIDEAAANDADVVVLGEMGIGNTTAAAAVAAALDGGARVASWVGRGTGVDDDTFARKLAAVEAACARTSALPPLEILRHCGGAELTAIAAAVLRTRQLSIPVLLDGFVVTAAASALDRAAPGMLDHCAAAHLSPEPGHALLLEQLGKRPLLDLALRLGEGTGGLLALPILRMAAAAVVEVATFSEWGMA